jgi:hypothetical protein
MNFTPLIVLLWLCGLSAWHQKSPQDFTVKNVVLTHVLVLAVLAVLQ